MKKLFIGLLLGGICANALALEVKSRTRTLTVDVQEQEISATLCNYDNSGCLADVVNLEIAAKRIEKGAEKLKSIVENSEKTESLREDMNAQIEEFGTAVYYISGLGIVHADSTYMVDRVIKMLPQVLEQLQSVNVSVMFLGAIENYKTQQGKKRFAKSEADFGKALDEVSSHLILQF